MKIEALQELVDAEVARFTGADPEAPFTEADANSLTGLLLAIIDQHGTRRVGLWVRGTKMGDVKASVSVTVRYPAPTPPPRYVYLVGDYDEHGLQNARLTMDPERLPAMIAAIAPGNLPWIAEATANLAKFLALDHAELATKPVIHLHEGWGGAVLHVVIPEENKP